MGTKRAALLVVVAASVMGCTGEAEPEPPQAASPGGTARSEPATRSECVDPQPGETGLLELRGVAPDDGELWALIFGSYPARQGREIKIVWRMTGEGRLVLSATGPHGRRVTPQWGPEEHPGSNWDRPGDEWGSGWRFPRPGCWTVHVVRGTDHATAGIRVTR